MVISNLIFLWVNCVINLRKIIYMLKNINLNQRVNNMDIKTLLLFKTEIKLFKFFHFNEKQLDLICNK